MCRADAFGCLGWPGTGLFENAVAARGVEMGERRVLRMAKVLILIVLAGLPGFASVTKIAAVSTIAVNVLAVPDHFRKAKAAARKTARVTKKIAKKAVGK